MNPKDNDLHTTWLTLNKLRNSQLTNNRLTRQALMMAMDIVQENLK